MASLGQLSKALKVTLATAAAGIALQACSAQQPSSAPSPTSSTAFEPSSSVARAPLSPPMGYAAQENAPPPTPYDPINEGPEPVGKWHASPRWSAVQGDGCVVVDQKSSSAGHIDVENCPSNEGLEDQTPAGGY